MSALGVFEAAYTSAGLDANGPTLTYPLFKTMNAISDGLMIAVILLVSVLVVMIAFMCIRFTLLADIHRDGTTILLVTHDVKIAAKTERVLCMFDGQIAGEYLAGAYDETCNNLNSREERLTSWLVEMKL
jgi:hypothetical protein